MRSLADRLTRRALLGRSARFAAGAAAAVLVGCAGEEVLPADPPREQPRPGPEPQVEQGQAAAAQAEPQQEQEQPAAQQSAPQQQQTVAQQQEPQEQQSSEPAQTAAAAPEPAPRRRLVPDLECSDCSLEDPEFEPLPGATAEWGVIEGAGYRIELPEDWNGDLILWAHGFSGLNEAGDGPSSRLEFSVPEREAFLATGAAWAASTYRASGYVPGVGVDDLLLVKDRFAELFGAPRRTACIGASMGGATAQLMAQEFPEEIDGAVALCGALGNVWVVDYLAAWHTLAMWFIGAPPPRVDAAGLLAWSAALGAADEEGNLRLNEQGERFAAVIEHLTGGPRWGFREGLAEQWNTSFAVGALTWPSLIDAAPFTPGERITPPVGMIPMDTAGFVYDARGVDLDLERLNAEVVRLAANPIRRADPGVGAPSGRLEAPLLCLKTTGDLFTPIHLDRDYQRLVAAAGHADNLVVRAVRRSGHCTFSAFEYASAVAAFLAWMGAGVRPAGEELGDDLETAGAGFTLSWDPSDPLRR